ncbi:16S rRNA (cytidine(1402)-2'-O)-methyltransferase [Tissierella sp. Yu-01]|uniref:16S rRNA (cytidine(1402)-2'-O)-methyltransferase n=1 Tax=Tissierella sp. Yu-01 TaxID=3035694 RepID=UPI00240DEC45|nr:16S rRNA (cytidine(1402)-2'-O)-methyltransferase [Tissierella sp. Yu-01]WFA08492.1 16S rRNA (cytidine(1402)-2'-O)-methyltransferase [Tissierella sp. Yu-01]
MNNGKLYICPTPIGNLEDITLRTLRILGEVDLIACEDTRHSLKLLNHYEIKKPLTSYHEHNVKEKGPELIQKLIDGKNIAIITDAGMPGISDPGEDIIRLAIEEGIDVVGLPGPSASITALVVSGISTDKFAFEGFLPSKKRDRIKALEELINERRTIIFYESPHRIKDTLEDMLDKLGNRNIAIVRELTKIHEEIYRGDFQGALSKFSDIQVKGEFVIIVEGNKIVEKVEVNIEEELIKHIESGMSKKDAIKRVVDEHKIPKNLVYAESLKLR